MKQFIQGPLPDSGRNLMRRLGYGETPGYKGQISYQRRLQQADYPKFHVYLEEREGGLQVSLHIDQKKASYSGTSAHAGEYEGPLVEQEIHRIVQTIESWKTDTSSSSSSTSPPDDKPGFFSSLFGL